MFETFLNRGKSTFCEANGFHAELIHTPDKGMFARIKKPKVSIICPAYNAAGTIGKTIESVKSQTLPADELEFIIVDDRSTDSTVDVVKDYIAKGHNIILAQMEKNSGCAGIPRNIGIEISSGLYTMFIDADDWFHDEAAKTLSSILDETGDDYVVGKTVHVRDTSFSVVGPWQCDKERRGESPFDIPQFFYHMGPVGRMMRTAVIKSNNISYINTKFGEDKAFFFDVLTHCRSVSTTRATIYYQNRLNENSTSLTRIMDALKKRECDLTVIEHVKKLDLPEDKMKVLMNRIYEYDFMRTFKSKTFVNAKNKQDYYDLLQKAFDTAKSLNWDIVEEMHLPLYRTAARLFQAGKIKEFNELFKWEVRDNTKEYEIIDGIPYAVAPVTLGDDRYIELPLHASILSHHKVGETYRCIFEMSGSMLPDVQSVIIQDKSYADPPLEYEIEQIDAASSLYAFNVPSADLAELRGTTFLIAVKSAGYQLMNLKQNTNIQFDVNGDNVLFYISQVNNLTMRIKRK